MLVRQDGQISLLREQVSRNSLTRLSLKVLVRG
jgi:hypothetical protein